MKQAKYLIGLLFLIFYSVFVVVSYKIIYSETLQKNKLEPILVEKQVSLNPVLVPVCSCESTGQPDQIPQQFDKDGKVIRGKKNPNDVGACQINLTFHQSKAESMGLNLLLREDNIIYANYLYEKEGTAPWNWSKSCWFKDVNKLLSN